MNNRRHRRRGRHAAPGRRGYHLAAASAACAIAAGTTGALLHGPGPHPSAGATPVSAGLARADGNEVSRNFARTAPPSVPSSPLPSGPVAPPSPTRPAAVAGLDPAQTGNAATIVRVAKERGLPQRAMVVAIATATQESDLRNVANSAVPESLDYPHEGVEVDYDSVGVFQQRSSQGWGTVAELMDPAHAAGLFFDRLVRVSGWQSMSVSGAAQAVQRSAFPDAYQKHQDLAERVVGALL